MFKTSSHLIIPRDTAGTKLHALTNADKSISSERSFRDEKHLVWFVWSGLWFITGSSTERHLNYSGPVNLLLKRETSVKSLRLGDKELMILGNMLHVGQVMVCLPSVTTVVNCFIIVILTWIVQLHCASLESVKNCPSPILWWWRENGTCCSLTYDP